MGQSLDEKSSAQTGLYKVNRKKVQRLMRLMGLQAIYPKPKTSRPHPEHKVYPYLLRNLNIERANQVPNIDFVYQMVEVRAVKVLCVLFQSNKAVRAIKLIFKIDPVYLLVQTPPKCVSISG